MGWWGIKDENEYHLLSGWSETGTELAIGDGPADVMDNALNEIAGLYQEEFEREPTSTELKAVFNFCMGGREAVKEEEEARQEIVLTQVMKAMVMNALEEQGVIVEEPIEREVKRVVETYDETEHSSLVYARGHLELARKFLDIWNEKHPDVHKENSVDIRNRMLSIDSDLEFLIHSLGTKEDGDA